MTKRDAAVSLYSLDEQIANLNRWADEGSSAHDGYVCLDYKWLRIWADSIESLRDHRDTLHNMLQQLRAYIRHHDSCPVSKSMTFSGIVAPALPCECGLAEVLGE